MGGAVTGFGGGGGGASSTGAGGGGGCSARGGGGSLGGNEGCSSTGRGGGCSTTGGGGVSGGGSGGCCSTGGGGCSATGGGGVSGGGSGGCSTGGGGVSGRGRRRLFCRRRLLGDRRGNRGWRRRLTWPRSSKSARWPCLPVQPKSRAKTRRAAVQRRPDGAEPTQDRRRPLSAAGRHQRHAACRRDAGSAHHLHGDRAHACDRHQSEFAKRQDRPTARK